MCWVDVLMQISQKTQSQKPKSLVKNKKNRKFFPSRFFRGGYNAYIRGGKKIGFEKKKSQNVKIWRKAPKSELQRHCCGSASGAVPNPRFTQKLFFPFGAAKSKKLLATQDGSDE